MDKILKTLHLRLDSTSVFLTKNAISQLIIKVLFQYETPINISLINQELERILKTKIEENRILEALNKLLEQNEIKYEKKNYSLTKSNRKTLKKKI